MLDTELKQEQLSNGQSYKSTKSGSAAMQAWALIISIIALFISLSNSGLKSKVDQLSSKLSNIDLTNVNSEIESIKTDLASVKIDSFKGYVDLTIPDVQEINKSFYVSELSARQNLTGVIVTGRIINPQMVTHLSATFKIRIAGQSREFLVTRISPGRSTGFEVYVPDVPVEKSNYGIVEYLRSTVSYYM